MLHKKNYLMLQLVVLTALLNVVIYFLVQFFDVFTKYGISGHGTIAHITTTIIIGKWVFFLLPILFLGIGIALYMKDSEHFLLPLINVIALTFGSMGIISSSGGGVEFHFSIFMVLAMAAYYESVMLMIVMTAMFAVQHVLGYFFIPQIIFGTDDYPFLMLAIHALFLLLTSFSTIRQILSKQGITAQLEREKREKDESLLNVMREVENLSTHIKQAANNVSTTSEGNIAVSAAMDQSFTDFPNEKAHRLQTWDDSEVGQGIAFAISIDRNFHYLYFYTFVVVCVVN